MTLILVRLILTFKVCTPPPHTTTGTPQKHTPAGGLGVGGDGNFGGRSAQTAYEALQDIVPIKYGTAQFQKQIPFYPIFYLLHGGCNLGTFQWS